ncbi:MAG: hypothetical protein RL414_1158, partial [Actinomycetota bacterium]
MSNNNQNYYEILGIPASAGFDEIRAVYRRLAFQYHPDRNSDQQAQEFFQQVIEAFSVLSDPEKRKEYDAVLFSSSRLISSPLTSVSASELYDDIASRTSNNVSNSGRDEYLRHLRNSRRRRAFVQTVLAIIIILLLLLYGFKPLRTSAEGVSPTAGSTTTTTTNGKPQSSGSSLNQNLIV